MTTIIIMDNFSYLHAPVSFSFFASACLLTVEILLSIPMLVIADTVCINASMHIILALYHHHNNYAHSMLISFLIYL